MLEPTWTQTRIGEVCQVGDGAHASIKRVDDGVLYLSSKNLKDGKLDLSKVDYITQESFEKHFRVGAKAVSRPKPNDVIFGIIGSIGEAHLVKPDDHFGLSSSVAVLRPNVELVDPNYLFCWVRGHLFRNALYAIKGGVAQSYISLEMIRSLPFNYPSLETQRRIAAILSAYDDLIENNQKRIKVLEEMVGLIYREWFVNFRFPGHERARMVASELGKIPEGWQVVSVSEAVALDPTVKAPKGEPKAFVPMSGLNTDSMLLTGFETRTSNSGAKFQNGDTLFARITPSCEHGKTGFVQFLPSDESAAVGSTEFIVMRSHTLNPYFVYCLARVPDLRQHAIKSMSGASGRQRVQKQCFDTFKIAHPTQDVLAKFAGVAAPMFRLIHALNAKNQNLRQTRDLLLPKLISGELEVSAREHLAPVEAVL